MLKVACNALRRFGSMCQGGGGDGERERALRDWVNSWAPGRPAATAMAFHSSA